LGVLTLVLGACSSGPGTGRLVVSVREGSERPVADALVVCDSLARDHPFSIATILGSTGAQTRTARTGVDGTARLEFVRERSVRLTVVAPGRGPGVLFLGEPGASQVWDWRRLEGPSASADAGGASEGIWVRVEGAP
jgi:hypothetical protein